MKTIIGVALLAVLGLAAALALPGSEKAEIANVKAAVMGESGASDGAAFRNIKAHRNWSGYLVCGEVVDDGLVRRFVTTTSDGQTILESEQMNERSRENLVSAYERCQSAK